MNKVISILIVFLTTTACYGQSFDVRSIFNSGATAGIEYLSPSAINDSTNFQLTKYKLQFVKVLRTKQPDFEDFNDKKRDAKANQLFLASKFSVAAPNLSYDDYFKNIYKGELEITYITVSKKRGVWLHAANVSMEESKKTLENNLTPNFKAYSVYIHAKNLNFIPFVGPGIGINQGKFFFLPIFGFRAKLTEKLAAEFIVPVHAKLKYNYTNKIAFEWATYFSGINAVYREGSRYSGNDNTINLKQLKTYLAVNTRLSTRYKFKIELGYAFFQKLDGLSTNFSQKMPPMPFCNVSINYNFANSILFKFFNMEKPKKLK